MGALTSWIAAKLAFFPPDPPSYKLQNDQENGKLRLSTDLNYERDRGEVLILPTRRDNDIVTVYVKNPSASLTVLYSHGNATDIGHMFKFYVQLSDQLSVNVMGYDYSGYGLSTGEPSEQATYADIEAAYTCLKENYGVKEEDIVLYGQSVGSGPTLDLAIRLPRLRAVILHNAILSGLRVMYRMKRTPWFDIYKNIDKIPLVNCPVLVVHGTDDEVVDISHSKKLWELCKEKYEPLWLEGGNHFNLELFPEFFRHLKKFIRAIEKLPVVSNDLGQSTDQAENPPNAANPKSRPSTEKSRWSIDQREKPRPSFGQKEKSRPSMEVPRSSADRRERSRRSTDQPAKARNSTDHSERGRNSIDRIGDMVRSVALCNVDCLKQAES
ncbi:hypothetical protein NMG60_11009412 [Bertholletia excelsa]